MEARIDMLANNLPSSKDSHVIIEPVDSLSSFFYSYNTLNLDKCFGIRSHCQNISKSSLDSVRVKIR